MSVRLIESDHGFEQELEAAGVRLVVVNFICEWSTTSATLESHFEQLSNKYPRAIFLKVNIDNCKITAIAQCVPVPTLFFYRNKTKIDHLQNANLDELEAKIQLHIGCDNADSGEDLKQGLMDLRGLITKNQCECLGGADNFPLEHLFTDGRTVAIL
ncbi:thioredoxin-like [Sitodiplosis mosellana]|uniref:thioredoxin-like n=1 Tax=Sitodiplosis mosellana TaxID=263140 RepID=UPI002443BC13|nr:thioredoxin-like [Sitodiplosis mosellana]